jgi:hypothetical protein
MLRQLGVRLAINLEDGWNFCDQKLSVPFLPESISEALELTTAAGSLSANIGLLSKSHGIKSYYKKFRRRSAFISLGASLPYISHL